MKVTIDIDSADVVEQVLKDDLRSLVEEIKRLRSVEVIKEYQLQDLNENILFASSILGALQYYMDTESYTEIFEKYSVYLS